jgi:hypothetical protein
VPTCRTICETEWQVEGECDQVCQDLLREKSCSLLPFCRTSDPPPPHVIPPVASHSIPVVIEVPEPQRIEVSEQVVFEEPKVLSHLDVRNDVSLLKEIQDLKEEIRQLREVFVFTVLAKFS